MLNDVGSERKGGNSQPKEKNFARERNISRLRVLKRKISRLEQKSNRRVRGYRLRNLRNAIKEFNQTLKLLYQEEADIYAHFKIVNKKVVTYVPRLVDNNKKQKKKKVKKRQEHLKGLVLPTVHREDSGLFLDELAFFDDVHVLRKVEEAFAIAETGPIPKDSSSFVISIVKTAQEGKLTLIIKNFNDEIVFGLVLDLDSTYIDFVKKMTRYMHVHGYFSTIFVNPKDIAKGLIFPPS